MIMLGAVRMPTSMLNEGNIEQTGSVGAGSDAYHNGSSLASSLPGRRDDSGVTPADPYGIGGMAAVAEFNYGLVGVRLDRLPFIMR
jgi:hypothetical protein